MTGAVKSEEDVRGLAEASERRGGVAALEELFAEAGAVPGLGGLMGKVEEGEPFADEAL